MDGRVVKQSLSMTKPLFFLSSLSIHGGFHLSRTGTLDLSLTSAPLALASDTFCVYTCVEMCEKKCEGNLMDWELTVWFSGRVLNGVLLQRSDHNPFLNDYFR